MWFLKELLSLYRLPQRVHSMPFSSAPSAEPAAEPNSPGQELELPNAAPLLPEPEKWTELPVPRSRGEWLRTSIAGISGYDKAHFSRFSRNGLAVLASATGLGLPVRLDSPATEINSVSGNSNWSLNDCFSSRLTPVSTVPHQLTDQRLKWPNHNNHGLADARETVERNQPSDRESLYSRGHKSDITQLA